MNMLIGIDNHIRRITMKDKLNKELLNCQRCDICLKHTKELEDELNADYKLMSEVALSMSKGIDPASNIKSANNLEDEGCKK